jgi:hypothetical protein
LLGAFAAGGIILVFLLRLVMGKRPRGVDAGPSRMIGLKGKAVTEVDPWQQSLRKWAILNGGLHANAGCKWATRSKSKTCRNAVDHKPISIKVEFDKPIAAHSNSGVAGAILYVLSDQ